MVATKAKAADIKALTKGSHSFGDGLWMRVLPSGRRSWFYQYAVGKARKKKTLGTYPDMSFTQANDKALELRTRVRLLKEDPMADERAKRAGRTVSTALDENLIDPAYTDRSFNTRKTLPAIILD